MDEQIVTIYCLCDDLLRAMHRVDDPQCQMSDAEVVTTALVATLYFGGNFERARALLAAPRYIPVSYTHLRAHETVLDLVCRLLLEKKKTHNNYMTLYCLC